MPLKKATGLTKTDIDGAYREGEGVYHLPELVRNVSKFPGELIYSYTLAYWKCTPEKLVANAEQYEYVLEQLATMEEEGGLWNWVKEQWYDYKEEKESLEQYFADCRDANEIREGVEELHYIVTNWDEIENLYNQVSQRISAYFSTLENTDNIGRYERGRLIVPVVSTALTLGGTAATKIEEIKNILKSLRTASEGSWKKVTEGIGKLLVKQIDFSKLDIPRALKHVKFRDLSDLSRRDIVGLHDAIEFAKLRHIKSVGNRSFQFPKNKTHDEVEEIVILAEKNHNTLPGVKVVEYRVPQIDGKGPSQMINGKPVSRGYTTGATKGEKASLRIT